MKILIEELEIELSDMAGSNCDYGELSGFAAAIDTVRNHNPWHDVSELPPMDEEPEFSATNSIDVLLTDSGIYYIVGYYDLDELKWVSDGYEHTFTHWTYLPEVNK